ncbi:MAG: DoxX family protein [Chthoniobacterales bacterium]
MKFLGRYSDPIYCIMRLVVGLMFMCHGLDKIFGIFGGKPPGMMMGIVGGWLELILGLLVAIGLLTRFAAFLASGEMAVAFFMVHAKASFIPYVNKGELAVVYCFIFLYIAARGAGLWSVDAMINRNPVDDLSARPPAGV